MDYSWGSIALFLMLVVVCLIIDLHAHKSDQAISGKNAALWTVFWILLSLAFGGYVWKTHGLHDFSLYMAGYLLEKSLSVDNLFVMMAIFAAFSVQDKYQHRVLYYGIIGALVLRLVFVALGSALLQAFGNAALVILALFVLWSAWKMWLSSIHADRDAEVDYTQHWSVKIARRFFSVYPHVESHNFFVRAHGRHAVTPLFLCLLCIEFADVMFAFDSVPAVLAVTEKPFLVYTSNIFAILGLRSMYFLLAAAKRYLVHLEKAVICILVYIGLKMLVTVVFGYHMPAMLSLAIVLLFLLAGVVASLLFPPRA